MKTKKLKMPKKPHLPPKPIEPSKIIDVEECIWSNEIGSYDAIEYNLVDILKKYPIAIPINELKIRVENDKEYGYYGEDWQHTRIKLYRVSQKENLEYDKQMEKYNKDNKAYTAKLDKYKKDMKVYKASKALYDNQEKQLKVEQLEKQLKSLKEK